MFIGIVLELVIVLLLVIEFSFIGHLFVYLVVIAAIYKSCAMGLNFGKRRGTKCSRFKQYPEVMRNAIDYLLKLSITGI